VKTAIRPAWWVASAILGLAVVTVPLASTRAWGQSGAVGGPLPQRFTAFATNMSNVSMGVRSQTIDIEITRWSTDAERDRLLGILKQKGENALLQALQDLPKVGYIRTPDSIGYDLHFAREHEWGDGGRRVFIATDRPIGFWEAANRPRVSDYPFTLIEMRLNHDGTGEGKLTAATKVTVEGKNIVLENYADQPVRLSQVRQERNSASHASERR
jgi:hypothetical protein